MAADGVRLGSGRSMLETEVGSGGDERNWLLQLDSAERTTLVGTFAGWMLDGLDVMVYSFVLPTLILVWHISKGQAGLLGTSALLLSSVGGWAAGLAADRFGRVRVLQWTIVWFAVFTFLSGFAQNFEQLLVLRGMQGLGFGGEWAVGSVLMGEAIRAKFRGRAVGTVQAGWAIGWGIAAGCYALAFAVLPQHLAWRAMFWVGLLPALAAVWVRHHVVEPDVYLRAAARRERASAAVFLKIFAPTMLRTTMLASVVALGAQGGYYAITTFLPLYLNGRGLSVTHTTGYLSLVIVGSFAGYVTSAHLADALGRKKTLVLFAAGAFLTVLCYTAFSIGDRTTLLLGFPLGFFPSGSFSPMGSFFTELFPTSVRGSGQGFSYNLGRGAGAMFPTLVGAFSAHMILGKAIGLFAASAYLVMIAGVLLLPETRNVELAVVDAS